MTGRTNISLSSVLRGCCIGNRLRSSNFVHHFIVVEVRILVQLEISVVYGWLSCLIHNSTNRLLLIPSHLVERILCFSSGVVEKRKNGSLHQSYWSGKWHPSDGR